MADQTTGNKAVRDQIALLTFIDDIIKERKDPDVKPENISQVKAVLLKEVNDSINRHLISLISEKDQVELDELLEKNVTDDELNEFFLKKIPQLEAEIASVLLNFRAAYLYPVTGGQPSFVKTSEGKPPTPPPAPVPVDKMN